MRDKNFEDNYYTYNKKLKLEEYDDEGNLIDVIEFNKKDLWDFYIFKNNGYIDFRFARKKDREYFKEEEFEIAKRIMEVSDFMYFDENTIKYIENILKTYTLKEIEYALNFKNYYYNEMNGYLSMEDWAKIKKMKFEDILKWIKEVDGIYYATKNDGTKGMMYLEKPTKKQAKYQRQKHGKRIVFLSFSDWKEYIVNEDDL
ncbi:hypothetical protein FDC58_16735 [Clostridium botulinum]|uniref:hypothetical protein n=1 Tax=Clostridium cagae TaxID=2080751 RepID=UPI000CF6997B|nr:hypothetical protein [Clostridium cagae]NFO86099.1 hypothetical protein [Clostridium botulinum]NFP30839.1 hypothetical protein [Clostridium botulinum]